MTDRGARARRTSAKDAAREAPAGRLARLGVRAAWVAGFALLALLALHRIWSTDFWWQLRLGRLVAAGGPPAREVFSYTIAGQPWVELRWLYAWALHLLVDRLGFGAAVLAQVAVVVASFGFALAAVPRRAASAAAPLALAVAALAASQRFTLRPELLTYLFLAVDLWILARLLPRHPRAGAALPLVQVVWSNTHTLFPLGPLVVGAYLAATLWRALGVPSSERRAAYGLVRAAGIWFVVTAVAGLLTPYGVRGYAFAWQLFTVLGAGAVKELIYELKSPLAVRGGYLAMSYFWVVAAWCVVVAVAARRRLDPFLTLVTIAMLSLALQAVRNVGLFALVSVPFIAGHAPAIGWPKGRLLAWTRSLACALVVGGTACYGWQLTTDRFYVNQGDSNQFGLGLARHRYPEAAAAPIAHPAGPRAFATLLEASYLVGHDVPVFIDPRTEAYGDAWLRRFNAMQASPAEWERTTDEFGITSALIDLESLGAIRMLAARPEWSLTAMDEVAVLFERAATVASPQPEALPAAERIARLRRLLPRPSSPYRPGAFERVESPRPYHRVGNALVVLGEPAAAVAFLEDAVAIEPVGAAARLALGMALERSGDLAAAGRARYAALERAPLDADALAQVALHELTLERPERARPLLERSVRAHPDHALSWALLGEVDALAGRLDDAERELERAVRLAPDQVQYAGRLAAVRAARRVPAGR